MSNKSIIVCDNCGKPIHEIDNKSRIHIFADRMSCLVVAVGDKSKKWDSDLDFCDLGCLETYIEKIRKGEIK